MSIATRFVSSTARPRLDLSGCVFYAPLWRPDLGGSTFTTIGDGGIPTHLCTVTGATWGIQGRTFDGSDDKITIPHSTVFNITNELTVEFWFKTSAGDDGYIINKGWKAGELGTNHPWFFVNVGGGTPRRIQFNISDNSPLQQDLISDTQLVANTFHHVVGTATNSLSTLYFNGVFEKSATLSGLPFGVNTADVWVGMRNANGANGFPFAGTVGEVSIFNRAFTASEVQQNYLTTKGRYV